VLEGYGAGAAMLQSLMQEYPDAKYSWGGLIAGEAAYRIGRFYYRDKDIANAKKAFDFALQNYPSVRMSTGMLYSTYYASYIKATNVAAAKGSEWIEKEIRRTQPGDPAEKLYRQADLPQEDDRLRLYDELQGQFPQHDRAGEALTRSASILAGKQRWVEAITRLRKIVEEYPKSKWPNGTLITPEAAYKIGSYYGYAKDIQNAKKSFDYALQNFRDECNDEGEPLAKRYEAQIKEVNAAVGKPWEGVRKPADAMEESCRRADWLCNQKPDEALKLYDDLLTKYPKHDLAGAAVAGSASALFSLGRFEEGIQRLQRVISEFPDSRDVSGKMLAPWAAYEIAIRYYLRRDMPNAKKAFDFALGKFPDASWQKGVSYAQHFAAMIARVNAAVAK
jgi:tetratricopeptide (TPR) repeat protein